MHTFIEISKYVRKHDQDQASINLVKLKKCIQICTLCNLSVCNFIYMYCDFEGRILVLVVLDPVQCVSFNF